MYYSVNLHLSNTKTATYTYSYNSKIELGGQVIIQLQNTLRVGIVVNSFETYTSKYKIKPIIAVLNNRPLNTYQSQMLDCFQEHTMNSYINLYELFVKPISDSKISFDVYQDNQFLGNYKSKEVKNFFSEDYELKPKLMIKDTAAKYQYVSCNPHFTYKLNERQTSLYEYVNEHDSMMISEIIKDTEFTRAMINTLIKHNVFTTFEQSKKFETLFEFNWHENNKLSPLQTLATEQIDEAMFPVLLHGISSSGKTEVYIDQIKKCVENNKQALVIVPSVSLAIQVIGKMQKHFKDVIIYHRNLTEDQKLVYADKIKNEKSSIVVATIEGLFLPYANLGLVVFDEAHDSSYDLKRGLNISKEIIVEYLSSVNVKVILGTATPDVLDYAKANLGAYELVTMKSRFGDSNLPEIQFVDEQDKRLSEIININQSRNKPTLIFYNHSGYAKQVMCDDCYNILKCPNCQKPLIYSEKYKRYECKYDGYKQMFSKRCGNCGSTNLKYIGVGIEKYTSDLCNQYPNLVIRFIDGKYKMDELYALMNDFGSGDIDILVGTRTIAFGIDFLNIDNIYIVNSDSMLFLNETNAGELTFQMLEQVAGRAGRNSKFSNAYIETKFPDNYIYQAIKNHDYEQFYNHEMQLRKSLKLQPYFNFCKIEVSDKNSAKLEYITNKLIINIEKHDVHVSKIQVPFIEMRYNTYRRYFLIRYRYENIKDIVSSEIKILDENGISYTIDLKNKEIGV